MSFLPSSVSAEGRKVTAVVTHATMDTVLAPVRVTLESSGEGGTEIGKDVTRFFGLSRRVYAPPDEISLTMFSANVTRVTDGVHGGVLPTVTKDTS